MKTYTLSIRKYAAILCMLLFSNLSIMNGHFFFFRALRVLWNCFFHQSHHDWILSYGWSQCFDWSVVLLYSLPPLNTQKSKSSNSSNALLCMIVEPSQHHSQYAGIDKWSQAVNDHDGFLLTAKWKGAGNFPLDKFCAKASPCFRTAQACFPTC